MENLSLPLFASAECVVASSCAAELSLLITTRKKRGRKERRKVERGKRGERERQAEKEKGEEKRRANIDRDSIMQVGHHPRQGI